MAASAKSVANEFLRLAAAETKPLTNMQLQKLVFLGQGYSLALLDRPAYFNNTHAWQWGPVVPALYKALQKYGSGQVSEFIATESNDDALGQEDRNVLRGVWNGYKNYSGSQLSEITHRPGSPWSKTWATRRFGVIPLEDIREYYASLVAPAR